MIVRFWINAFIPKTVGDYLKVVEQGPYQGQTAVPLPEIARLSPLNMTKDWEAGYLGDQRHFSKNIKASVRMQSRADFDISKLDIVEEPQHKRHTTSGTIEVNIETGEKTGEKKANMKRCHFAPSPSKSVWTDEQNITHIEYALKAAASDPLVKPAADIDYNGTIRLSVDKAAKQVKLGFTGKIDAFPAYEAYASHGDQIQTLFRKSPPVGNTVKSLVGGANRPVEGQATFYMPGLTG